ncbi:glycosyltransferase family 2 protein [Criblamydia sequanensis]|uniref:Glycosyl transferase n=1 Tax=Candidatus Criblamydia sequanensis CRIB-18 TaxID=1437425 RepID=A0A090D021_9BACT|nr:glycosyltransferase family A protein [Criblamydia sequanensis]CDR34636.1 Glycosyl transferase [Criblamydia sequanensis CRIB-18]
MDISVVIPCFNAGNYLLEALESVSRQTFLPKEIIVIDDGSTDDSIKKAKSSYPSVIFYHQSNKGPGSARNLGALNSKSEALCFLDADDLFEKTKLEIQSKALKESPESLIFGHVSQFLSPECEPSSIKTPNKQAGIHAGTLLLKRDLFLKIGLFPTNVQIGEFLSWYLKAKEQGVKIVMLPEVLMRRRIHKNNLSLREACHRSQFAKILLSQKLNKTK